MVDFEKAFDTVEHGPLWHALEELGVPPEYVNMLKLLYSKQESNVLACKDSRPFSLERGVKQGDPISSLLFLAVMECMFRRLKKRWHQLNQRRTGPFYGIVIDSELEPLSNLRFADDVILLASSRSDTKKMIIDLKNAAAQYGLIINWSKTKAMTTDVGARDGPLMCGEHAVQVLQQGQSEKYLGRKLSLDNFHTCELQHRVASGWAAFSKFKGALCNRRIPLSSRIALFEAVVTPCVLYACSTWVLNVEMTRKLQSAQRKMFRCMVRVARRTEEAWPEYIRRVTHMSEDLARSCNATHWASLQHERKLILAAKCRLCADARWSGKLLHWKPWHRCIPHRRIGHPFKRWTEELV